MQGAGAPLGRWERCGQAGEHGWAGLPAECRVWTFEEEEELRAKSWKQEISQKAVFTSGQSCLEPGRGRGARREPQSKQGENREKGGKDVTTVDWEVREGLGTQASLEHTGGCGMEAGSLPSAPTKRLSQGGPTASRTARPRGGSSGLGPVSPPKA